MAIPSPTQYQKRLTTRRRTSDITRLADQYQKSIESLTSEYQQSFAQYQKQTAETMAPYEAALKTYQEVQMPQYEQAAATYQQKAAEYQNKIQSYDKLIKSYVVDKSGSLANVIAPSEFSPYFTLQGSAPVNLPEGAWYSDSFPNRIFRYGNLPSNLQFVQTGTQQSGKITQQTGYLKFTGATDPYESLQKTPPGAFTEKAPVAPEAPQAPQIGEFDSSGFEIKKTQLESDLKRELGERRGARLTAVSRKSSRPMLQGT